MKTAFLLAAVLFLVPFTAAGSDPAQPAVKQETVQEAKPSAEAIPASPVLRKKIRHPDALAAAAPAVEAPAPPPKAPVAKAAAKPPAAKPALTEKQRIVAAYRNQAPVEWGENVAGIKTRLETTEPVVALTFDACGGPKGGKIDNALIDYLRAEKIPATLFVSGSWIDANPAAFKKLATDPLFEIENHGLAHRPCSVNGKSAYGIRGTASVGELVDEIEKNGRKIEAATGRKPKFYRPGTAYCDEVAVKVAGELGYEVVNYSVLGDAGATWPPEKIRQALLKAEPGAIVIMHMNQPRSRTAEGLKEAIPALREKGLRFVKLTEYPLR